MRFTGFFTRTRLCFFLLFFFCCSAATGQQTKKIDVSVSGIDDPLRQNVLLFLSIAQHQSDSNLTDMLVQRLYRQADEEIATALEPYGYYSATVAQSMVFEDSTWKARFQIQLNDPVHVTSLDVRLAGPGRGEKRLLEQVQDFPLKVGGVFDHQLYKAGKTKLTSEALGLGYRDVSFSRHTVVVDRREKSAAIDIIMDTGPRYMFGETVFEADFISHSLLRRMMPYRENDPYSPRILIQLRQALLGSDYFSNVEVRSGSASPETLKIPVTVTMQPGKKNKYGLGVGYGTDTGMRGSLAWTGRLLNRYGHQFSLEMQPSERKSYFGGVYTIPVRDPRKDRLSLLGKWENELFDNTESESRTLTISYDHIRKKGEYSLYLSFLDEDYDTGVETGHATLLTPGIKTTWRFADDRLRTGRGIRLSLNLRGGSEGMLSDTTFLQATLSSKGILAFADQWRFIGRFQAGATLFDDIYELPPSLRYYAGGDQSVRGYAYKSIGPENQFGNVLGGRYLLSYSAEIERSLSESWSAALFFDSGDAFNNLPEVTMRNGAGVGLRWNAPFGQVRLDFATPLDSGGDSWRIHFNVGADL